MRIRHSCVVLLLSLVGLQLLCTAAQAAPQRVVSTFLCTDEYVFRLLPPSRIAALTVLAGEHPPVPPVVSTIAAKVHGIRLIMPSAEIILNLKPDLVVMYQGTNPRLYANLQSAHIPILDVPWANSLSDIRAVTRMLGARLHVPARAAALIAAMDSKLQAAKAHAPSPPVSTLVYEPNGYATADRVTEELLSYAGLRDMAAALHPTRLGTIPVESVIADPPELLILNAARGRVDTRAGAVLQNPALRALKGKTVIAKADLRPLLCPGPWSADVLPALESEASRARALALRGAPP